MKTLHRSLALLFTAGSLAVVACGGSSDATGTTAASSVAGSTSSSGGAAVDCNHYCAQVMSSCAGMYAQYSDLAGCMAVCATLPLGPSGDTSGDTVACRDYHSGAAKGDPKTHCPHAGPLGDKTCGTSPCEAFCEVATSACKTEWPDKASCMTSCATLDFLPAYNADETHGDTLNCRMYHLSVAATSPANGATHCPHTAAMQPTGNPCTGAPF